MNKGKFLLSALCSILIVLMITVSYAGSKVDPYIKAMTVGKGSVGAKAASLNSSVNITESSDTRSIFIKTTNPEAVKELIKDNGGMVHTVGGSIMTASASLNTIDIIAESDDVEFIEGGKPIDLSNDMGSLETNTSEVHKGTNLPQAYTGQGVIIGVIDTGIDFSHPDFYDADGRSRILSVWNQTRSSGPYPMEIDDSFGTECVADSIVDGSCPLYDANGHGTHVAGTAAGSDETYRGVAPDANIIVVSYDSSVSLESGYAEPIFSTKICQAAYYVFAKASQLGMPAVINLSLGTHIGAHDGTSLFEECLSELLDNSAGRAIVAAAGNEYYEEGRHTGIHAGTDVNGQVASNFEIKKITNDRIYYIDVWGSAGSDLSVGLAIHDGDPSNTAIKYSGDIAMGDQSSGDFLGGAIEYAINFSETSSVLNGKPHAGIRIKLNSSFSAIDSHSFDLVLSGSGSFDAWLFPDKDSETAKPILFTDQSGSSANGWDHIPGDSLKTIAIPATSPNIIAVGAYTTRNRWDKGAGCCEVAFELDQLLDFSSAGPTPSPEFTGTKPDIAAPGGMIASTLSSHAQYNSLLVMPDGIHALQAGTSMAAPFVSGTIALMFSADHNFTYLDVKNALIASAYVDDAVGAAPNDRWGHGKLDVLAAVETAVNGGASGRFDRNESLDEPDGDAATSSGGNGGCTLMASTPNLDSLLVLFGMLIISITFVAIRRRTINA